MFNNLIPKIFYDRLQDGLDFFVGALGFEVLHRDAALAVAARDGAKAGFASLAGDRIDMLYVHPEHAGQGVATALVDALERLASARNLPALTTDASDTARDFFAARGYVAMQRNSVSLHGEWLANTTMKKQLTPAGATR